MSRLIVKTTGFGLGKKVFVSHKRETLVSEDEVLPTGYMFGVEVPEESGKYSVETITGTLLIIVREEEPLVVELSPWHTTTGDRYDLGMSVSNEPFTFTDRVASKFYHGIVRTAFSGVEQFSARWYFDTVQPIIFPSEEIKEEYFKATNQWNLNTGYLADHQSKVLIRGDTKVLFANNVIGIHKDTGEYIWGYKDWGENESPHFIRAFSSMGLMDLAVLPDGSILISDIDTDLLLNINPETGEVLGKITSSEIESQISEFFGEEPGWWSQYFSATGFEILVDQNTGDFTLIEGNSNPYAYSFSWENKSTLRIKQVIENSVYEPEDPEAAWAPGLVWSDMANKVRSLISGTWYYPRQFLKYGNFFIAARRVVAPTSHIDFYDIENGEITHSIEAPNGAQAATFDLNHDNKTLTVAYGSNSGYYVTIQEIDLSSYSVSDTFVINYPDFNTIKSEFTWDYDTDLYEGWDEMIANPIYPTSVRKLVNNRYMLIVYEGFYDQAMVYNRGEDSFEDFRLVAYNGWIPATASFNRQSEVMVQNGSYGLCLYDGKRYSNLPYFNWALTYPDIQHPSAFTSENTLTFYLRSNGGIACMSELEFLDSPEQDFSTGNQGSPLPEGWYTQSSELFKPPKFESTSMFGYMSPNKVLPYGNGFISGQRKFLNGVWEGNFTEREILKVFNKNMEFCFNSFSKSDDDSAYLLDSNNLVAISPGRLGTRIRRVSLDSYEELPMDITLDGLPTNNNTNSMVIKLNGDFYFFGVANRRTFRYRDETSDWEERSQIPTNIGSLTETNSRINYRPSIFADYRNFIYNNEFYYTLTNTTTVRKVIKYNPMSDAWSVVTDIPGTTDLTASRINFVYSGKIYYPILGQIYDIDGDSWGVMDPVPQEIIQGTSTFWLSWCVSNGILYLFRIIQHGQYTDPQLVDVTLDDYINNSIVAYALPGAVVPY